MSNSPTNLISSQSSRRIQPRNDFEPFPLAAIEQTIPARFEEMAALFGSRLAVAGGGQRLTYAKLNQGANAVAHALLEYSDKLEEPVAILLDQDASAITAILGVLKAGKISLPLDVNFPMARLAAMLESAQPEAIVTSTRHAALVQQLIASGAAEDTPIINLEDIDFRVLRDNPSIDLSPHHGAHLICTSGSTGQPKGVLQNHRNLLFEVRRITNSFQVSGDDRLAAALELDCGVGAAHLSSVTQRRIGTCLRSETER